MNMTLKRIAEICRHEPVQEKILFVPSHTVGHQIGHALAYSGAPWVNLRPTTAMAFAAETTFPEVHGRGLRFVESEERLAIIEDLYRRGALPAADTGYFKDVSTIPGILKALSGTIHELRMANLTSEMISPSAFLMKNKGEEIVALLKAYEVALEEKNLIDHAGLLALASETVDGQSHPGRIVMVLSDFPVSSAERKLIEVTGRGDIIVIPHDIPMASRQPSQFFHMATEAMSREREPETDSDLFKWILVPGAAPKSLADGTVSLFHALGESNEIREVFRRIVTGGVAADQVEVVVPAMDPYGPLIRDVAATLGLPVTFGSGIPVIMTRPGSALVSYLTWQAEDFAEPRLRHLVAGGSVDIRSPDQDESLSPRQVVSILRGAQIGWGRERYVSRLKSLADGYAIDATQYSAEGEGEKSQRLKEREGQVRYLAAWVDDLLKTAPEIDSATGMASRVAFYGSCLSFLEKYCRIASEHDAAARIQLIAMFTSLQSGPSQSDPVPVLAGRLIEMIGTLSVGHSGPRPGHLHVNDYRSAGWANRELNFVVGLDQGRFPGPVLQDPVLLDDEREKIGAGMTGSDEVLRERIYLMAKFFASASGRITISYPCRDLLDDRELLPSSFVLNAYRLISGNRSADYSHLAAFLGEPAGFVPQEGSRPLFEWEWWLSRMRHDALSTASILECYPNLKEGKLAGDQRTVDDMTVYDGHIPSTHGDFDPYRKNTVLSASQLEALAACPFRFFMTYLLHVEPLDDMARDPSTWLDGAQRGSLLHEVFRHFMEDIVERGERPDEKKHADVLKDLALKEVKKWKEIIPPPSTFAVQKEIGEILQTCITFLRDEEGRCRAVEPCFFELSFGMKGEGSFAYDAVEISVGHKGSFLLRGRIDRIDRSDEHTYEVWDYKTGSSWGYKETDYYREGRQIQHFLYSAAAEILLRRHHDPKASVTRGGYYFPGPKGEGQRMERSQTWRVKAFEILDHLFVLLATGVFPSAYDASTCTYCSYAPACGGGERAVARCKDLLRTLDPLLDPLRRLTEK
jgi:RecB family exonuclease